MASTHRTARSSFLGGALILAMLAAVPSSAQEEEAVAKIVDEGMNRSQIPQMGHELLDQIGPRLTNSPNMRRAEEWAIAQMKEIGLANVHREGFTFGRGWEAIDLEVDMLSPRPLELAATPVAWTPGTNGPLEAEVVVAPMTKEEHFETYRGKLAGKIVLVSVPGMGDEPTEAPFQRLTDSQMADEDSYDLPRYDPEAQNSRLKRLEFALQRDAFLKSEGALAWVTMSSRDGKLLHGSGYTFESERTPELPGIEMAAEDYRRLARLAKDPAPPRLRINSNVRFVDDDPKAYNIIGEIPGTDRSAGYVMAGAHFDSWAAGDGAADNGAGSLAVLEAARILKTTGVRPRRTIRFALWAGEEQGLLGSLAYIREHMVSRAGDTSGEAPSLATYYSWSQSWPVTAKPGYADMKAYFNIDNGSGKLRGLYGEGNAAARPLLQKWLSPFAMLDADRVVSGDTGGTDHVFMQAIGLPGFQFIQDPLDYDSRLHHTNVDTYDHLRPDDLRQAATVLAGVLVQSANDEQTLPREPLPTQPVPTDPFRYTLPDED